jgi:flagellar hook assembly protein FlgD
VPEIVVIEETAFLRPAPNPFNPQTELRFELRSASRVDLSIYNVKGERVVQLVARDYPAGRHAVTWAGRDQSGRQVPSGTYFARFQSDGLQATQRLVLLK